MVKPVKHHNQAIKINPTSNGTSQHHVPPIMVLLRMTQYY